MPLSEHRSATLFNVPKTCKGAVVVDEGPDFHVQILDVPIPEIKSDEVLIKSNVTGLCMSDVHFMVADLGWPKMSSYRTVCAGHEGAGVIVKVGEGVETLHPGQMAGCKGIKDVCHTCEYCKTGRDNYCQNATYYGLHVDGSFREYVVAPERYITLIPGGVSDYVAGPIMCSGASMYGAPKEANLQLGDWAVFSGGGGGVGL